MGGAVLTTDRIFQGKIAETPQKGGIRLIYADWLEEYGQAARAEFIRTQCQLAAFPLDHPSVPHLREQEQKLWEEHGLEWAVMPPRGQVAIGKPIAVAAAQTKLHRQGAPLVPA